MQVFVFTLITQISEDTLTGEEISIKTVTDHLYFKVIGAEILTIIENVQYTCKKLQYNRYVEQCK